MELLFITHNENKKKEVQAMLGELYTIKHLDDIGFYNEIPEPHETLEENALEKTRVVYFDYKGNCFAEDTGLEVEELGGAPGVYSARYAGEEKSVEKNMDKLLAELKGKANRSAQFRTVLSLILDDREYAFEGIVKGKILEAKKGEKGFGYDPLFQPDGFDVSFAQMDSQTKNEISHRGRAVKKLVQFLRDYSASSR